MKISEIIDGFINDIIEVLAKFTANCLSIFIKMKPLTEIGSYGIKKDSTIDLFNLEFDEI